MLVEYAWPGNVRELRNLVESMVVLAPGREIGPADIPRQIREGGSARFLPVHVGPDRCGSAPGVEGRELEFIVRSLVELKLQVEELRRQLGEERTAREQLTRAASECAWDTNECDGRHVAGPGAQPPALGSGRRAGVGRRGAVGSRRARSGALASSRGTSRRRRVW